MRILGLGISIIFSIIAVIFSLSNRKLVELDLWPIQLDITVTVPVYLLVLGPLVIGVLLGGFIVWASTKYKRFYQKR